MAPELKPIDPKTPRWEPTADPTDIVVPGLDTTAPPYDQIEQIEQLITIKLQVPLPLYLSLVGSLITTPEYRRELLEDTACDGEQDTTRRQAVCRRHSASTGSSKGAFPILNGTLNAWFVALNEAAAHLRTSKHIGILYLVLTTYRGQFWTTFYEQAAQIRIPTYDDYSAGQEQTEDGEPSETSHTASDSTPAESSATQSDSESDGEAPHQNRTFDRTPSEVSFAPGQAAVSSTPATAYRSRSRNAHDDTFASQTSEPMPSWSASLDSPLMQLNHDIQSLAEDRSLVGRSAPATDESEDFGDSEDATQRAIAPVLLREEEKTTIHASDKGKARDGPRPLLHKVPHRNANTSNLTATTGTTSRTTSPLKFKPKTPVIKTLNPYIPPDSNPSDWKGVVDLKDPAVASPQRSARKLVPPPSSSIKLSAYRPSAAFTARANARSGTGTKTPPPGDDDSFDENFGMSPPVMTDYARLPKLGRTPKQEAAARIMKDLVDVERRGVFGPVGAAAKGKGVVGGGYGTESSMSSMPTPPSMTRYSRPSYVPPAPSETNSSVADASLDSIMRRVGLSVPGYSSQKPAPEPTAQPSRQAVFSSLSSASSVSSAAISSASPAFSTTSSRSAALASISHTLQPAAPPEPEPSVHTPQPPQYDFYDDEVIGRGGVVDGGGDDSLDSLDYEDQNTGTAPADFLFANQDSHSFDEDSFDSSMGDDDEPTDGTAPPFIVGPDDGGDGFDDDSFDDGQFEGQGEEETVFGVPPAQRLAQQQAQMAQGGLRMLGQDLLQDTIGIGQQMAMAGRVEESPTPWNGRGSG